MTVLSSRREVLSVVQLSRGIGVEEAALQGFDSVLARGRLERVLPDSGRREYAIGLYDPYTAEVALGALPKTKVFADRRPVAIEEDGCLGHLDESGLWIGDRLLVEQAPSALAVTRAAAAYDEASARS